MNGEGPGPYGSEAGPATRSNGLIGRTGQRRERTWANG